MRALICFAVAQEKHFFRAINGIQVIVTGMGAKAAEESLTSSLRDIKPQMIIAAGFAGGLNPDLKLGQLIFDSAQQDKFALKLSSLPNMFCGRIHSDSKVIVSPEAKAQLRKKTNADAVDMESASVRLIAKRHGIPMVSIRVISDPYDESLPLDFNLFMNERGGMHYGKLAFHLIKHPGTVINLVQFQKKVQFAARRLGESLHSILEPPV